VRRQLLVVLAGFQELDAVALLARGDPDGTVRATAARYLVKLAGGRPELWQLAGERLADRDAVVREAVIEELDAGSPGELLRAALARCDDPSLDVRGAVGALAGRLAARTGRLPEAVRARVASEPDGDLRQRWHQLWLRHHGASGLVAEVAATGDESLVSEALAAIAASGAPVEWSDVEPAAPFAGGPAGHRLVGLFDGRLDEVPLSVLLRYLDGAGRREACAWPFVDHLQGRLRTVRARDLSASDHAALADLSADARRMEDALAGAARVGDDEVWQEAQLAWREAIAEFAAECDRLSR
jgi:hypothetical protein